MATDKQLAPEEEYFARMEREKKAALGAEVAQEKAAAEREQLRILHRQRCGKCGGLLQARPFRGVEIDVCGDCGAVVLDPGELETLAGKDESGVVASLASLFSFGRKKDGG